MGDRQANTYRRDSVVYAFDPAASGAGAKMLTPLQKLPTLGATDFRSFKIGGVTFLAVSNEQDDTRGGDVSSTIWALRRESKPGNKVSETEQEESPSPGARDEL